jgi:hypothetical protein
MSTLLVYESDDGAPTHRDDLSHALETLGTVFDASADVAYRPGHWQDPHTGARVIVDLGDAPIENDEMHPPTSYIGWRPVALTLHIPLSTPHWQAVEAFAWVQRLLTQLPHLTPLDVEDTRVDEDADPGPFAFDRLRALASWERQHATQTDGRSDLPRMARVTSLALWRYRRERQAGQLEHAACVWPEALVVSEARTAHSVAVWADVSKPLALPPVTYLVLPRAEGPGLIPIDEVLTAAGGGTALSKGMARRIDPIPAITSLYQHARLLPATRYAACIDGDWSD